ncbi:MAG: glycosyltransferase family 87 protein [Alphaproteobacteria bacterium]
MQAIKANSETDGLERSFRSVVIFWSILLLIYSAYCGILFDHKHYVEQWQLMLSGGDPWSTDNTYGPLHNVVGYLFLIHPLAPKLFMVGALLFANYFLFEALTRRRGLTIKFLPYLLAVPTNVLVLGMGLAFGLNDVLVAALLIFAIFARFKGLYSTTGVLIGLAALMKFYPILLLPFFALEYEQGKPSKISWSLIIAGSIVFAVGIGASYLVWGPGLFRAIANGAERGASLMSIFADIPRLGWDTPVTNFMARYNALFVLAGAGIVWLLAFVRRWNWLESAVLGYLAILMIYKVGHQQFFMPWLFLVAALPLVGQNSSDRLSFLMIPMAIYLSVFHFAFDLGTNLMGNRAEWIETRAGIISFPILLVSLLVGMISLHVSHNQNKLRA